MSQYWLHVNHPTNQARIHTANGCASVKKAVTRVQSGAPYGPIHGNRNGYWTAYTSIQEAEAAQEERERHSVIGVGCAGGNLAAIQKSQ
jgi:hypothetical protein